MKDDFVKAYIAIKFGYFAKRSTEVMSVGDVVRTLFKESNGDKALFDKKISDYTYCEEAVLKEYVDAGVNIRSLEEHIVPRNAFKLYRKNENNGFVYKRYE